MADVIVKSEAMPYFIVRRIYDQPTYLSKFSIARNTSDINFHPDLAASIAFSLADHAFSISAYLSRANADVSVEFCDLPATAPADTR